MLPIDAADVHAVLWLPFKHALYIGPLLSKLAG
jgi:hypothetical protein